MFEFACFPFVATRVVWCADDEVLNVVEAGLSEDSTLRSNGR